MATRVGIELLPSACRIVEIDAGVLRQPRAETRVRAVAALTRDGADTRAALAELRRRAAAVVVWGAATDHRQVIVTNRSYERMRREALATLQGIGVATDGTMCDIAPVPVPPDTPKRRPVVVALASTAAIQTAIQPPVD